MAKPSITTRAGKGSALTWTEGDANLTNLQNATVAIKAGSAGTSVVSDLNGEITLVAGTNITLTGDNTAKTVTIDAAGGSSGGLTAVADDTAPTLGGNLEVGTYSILADTGDWIRLGNPNTFLGKTSWTGSVYLTTDQSSMVIGPDSMGNYAGGGKIQLTKGADGGVTITANGNGSISLVINGTGKTIAKNLNYNEGAIYDLGTTGGTIAPNVANGNVQKITLNSALTMNAFTSPVAGQSLTLIIYGGTAYTSITSTMKFAGGIKTLTATAGCIDILSVYYDGTTYFASLGKGFA